MNLDDALEHLAREPTASYDTAELALELARDEFPALDVEAYLSELESMAHEARRYVRGELSAAVTGLCRYLFHEMGFRGNIQHYYDSQNSYLNQVLDRRTGIPLTLSLVAMAVGNRAGLAVAGVGLPGHFVALAVADGRQVLFDPFHGGRQLEPDDCERLVERVTGQPFPVTATTLQPASAGQIARRLLSNLKGIYLNEGDFARAVRIIHRLRQLQPDDPLERRDLGVALLRAGQPGRAIDHLAAFLRDQPHGPDADKVRQLLEAARSQVARWN
jgi:regulator of sirC expression with transglutaminase-like and TPR domain